MVMPAPQRKRGTILKNRLLAAAALTAACLFPAGAHAGLFSVTPVRIFMAPHDRATAVTITNEGDQELVMQADIYAWKQRADGSDDLALSEDLILAPPIIKIPARGRQVVRLAMITPPTSRDQATYRMILREIPEAHAADKKVQLQIALAFSLPVFITPQTAKRELACSVARSAPDAVTARCVNRGNAYAQPRELALTGADGAKIAGIESATYLLPGTAHAYEIKRAGGAIPSGPAKLAVNFDDGTSQAFDVTVGD
jgi:fimbrial chaperone protein